MVKRKIDDEISHFSPLPFHQLIHVLTVIILETRKGWLISWPSRKCMLLPPQDLPGFHILKKSLKGLCGSLSSSCPLCRWGGCWPGPAGVSACRKGVFLSCKGGDNRKREERQHIYTLHWNHLCVCLSPPLDCGPWVHHWTRSGGLGCLIQTSQEPSPRPDWMNDS